MEHDPGYYLQQQDRRMLQKPHDNAPRDHDQVEYATLEYVDWFNHRRLLKPIGHIPSSDREADYYCEHTPAQGSWTQLRPLLQTRYSSNVNQVSPHVSSDWLRITEHLKGAVDDSPTTGR